MMYLSRGRIAPKGLLFDVPHKPEPMTIKEIEKELPKFAALMDGNGDENTLLFYYKKNKETGHYIFQDSEAEADIAEMMGVEIGEFSNEETVVSVEALSVEELELHKENLMMIREGLKKIG
jgi:hypothetical protein